MTQKFLCVGAICEDTKIFEDENVVKCIGGVAYNLYGNLTSLGAEANLFSAVGDDVTGSKLLTDPTLHNARLQVMNGDKTAFYKGIFDSRGNPVKEDGDVSILNSLQENLINQKEVFAQDVLEYDYILSDLNMSLVIFDGLPETERQRKLILVPSCLEQLELALARKENLRSELMVINFQEFKALVSNRELAEREVASSYMASWSEVISKCVVTLGAKGAMFLDAQGANYFAKASETESVGDVIGAGDAFAAAMVHALYDLALNSEEALHYASRIAARVVGSNKSNLLTEASIEVSK